MATLLQTPVSIITKNNTHDDSMQTLDMNAPEELAKTIRNGSGFFRLDNTNIELPVVRILETNSGDWRSILVRF